jgi:hypothetical protein
LTTTPLLSDQNASRAMTEEVAVNATKEASNTILRILNPHKNLKNKRISHH